MQVGSPRLWAVGDLSNVAPANWSRDVVVMAIVATDLAREIGDRGEDASRQRVALNATER